MYMYIFFFIHPMERINSKSSPPRLHPRYTDGWNVTQAESGRTSCLVAVTMSACVYEEGC